MPNWASCELIISGEKNQIDSLLELVKTDNEEYPYDLTRVHPCPEELTNSTSPFNGSDEEIKNRSEKYGAADWYEWRIQNWGAKWAPCNVELENPYVGNEASSYLSYTDPDTDKWCALEDIENIKFTFDSPWAPPTRLIEKLAEKFPKVKFQLWAFEAGMGYQAYACFTSGKLEDEGEMTYIGNRGG